MTTAAAAIVPKPSKVRSKITNDPSQRHGRSAEARRVKDLFASYIAALGGPVDVATQALVLSAAEHVAIAERTRADVIAGKLAPTEAVRSQGAADRALRRIGLNRPATPPRKTFQEKMAEAEAALRAAEARAVADAAQAPQAALESGHRTDAPGSQSDGVAA